MTLLYRQRREGKRKPLLKVGEKTSRKEKVKEGKDGKRRTGKDRREKTDRKEEKIRKAKSGKARTVGNRERGEERAFLEPPPEERDKGKTLASMFE